MSEYYDNDLTADESLVSLEAADGLLSQTVHGVAWTQRATDDRRACSDDPEQIPSRDLDKAALRDASTMLAHQPWRGHKVDPSQSQPFPRRLTLSDGRVISNVPREIAQATALLAAAIVERSEQAMSPEVFRSYQIGEVRGEFRAPIRDDLPRHVRTLIEPFATCGASWSMIRP